MPIQLSQLPFSFRLGITLLVLVLFGGLAASMRHLVSHHENRDERPGLSLDDLTGAYHGMTSTAALIPALVNLVVVNVEGQPIQLIVPDPFIDAIADAFEASLPPGIDVVFVDDWYGYHVQMGEVHCGTAVSRTPTNPWWQQGLHLLEGAP